MLTPCHALASLCHGHCVCLSHSRSLVWPSEEHLDLGRTPTTAAPAPWLPGWFLSPRLLIFAVGNEVLET